MFIGDTFVDKTIEAFLVPVIWSTILYFAVNRLSRLGSPTPRQIYSRRLVLMTIVTVAWCTIYSALAPAFIGNGSDHHNAERFNSWMATRLGHDYGIPVILAWLLVTLIDWPKIKPDTSP